jgi:uncharacterized protein YqjF (DUF2071 family)
MNKKEILVSQEHRPFPLPNKRWIMQQTWKYLLFLHYKVPFNVLRNLVPEQLELDTYRDEAWISITPFKMRNVRFRGLPPIPSAYNFLELNLRTYVKFNGKSGIYFFSLDTSSTLSALGARVVFLPYFRAKMKMEIKDQFYFTSKRIFKFKAPAILKVKYRPGGTPLISKKGSLEEWLVERYCLFQDSLFGNFIEINIHHLPWNLQKAEVQMLANSLTEPFGFFIPDQQPLVHFAQNTNVLIWPAKLISLQS